ncbi:hypothetical protein PIB30_045651 [Stylosanthes scabra]|uniref:3-hydroxyisobutyryl-CoA hydrolase n=1 Tax=Stylosanthes scabra TaxID=79078 RepID=A0ABU6YEJ5_9FABA|nr:hypothetical protein [Stylosanthes scabra]
MALSLNFSKEPLNQILTAGNSSVKLVILNRPPKLNSLNHEMISLILKNLKVYESDSSVKLVILKGNGKGFCAGGDVVSVVSSSLTGHWTYPVKFYEKQLILDHLTATYKKPLVSLINGMVMGGGAGLSMNSTFRIVTEKAENEIENGGEEKWITNALSSMHSSSPISLKIFLKSIRKGRIQNIEQCLYRDYKIASHILRRTLSNDFYEGSRAKLFDKDNKPKWKPSKLELVSEEMVNQHFRNMNDDEWEPLQLPQRSDSPIIPCRL